MRILSLRKWFSKHPRGLWILCWVEACERFSYYGMRSIFMLYMIHALLLPEENAGHIYGFYTAGVYLMPLLGGYLADRFLGQLPAACLGLVLMALGHFLMAWQNMTNLYGALVLLVLGCGLFKSNISVLVGQLYPQEDSRRDDAYRLFYLGINVGAFLSPFVCGFLGERWGWHYGFTAAGIVVVFGLFLLLAAAYWQWLVPFSKLATTKGSPESFGLDPHLQRQTLDILPLLEQPEATKDLLKENTQPFWAFLGLAGLGGIFFWAIFEQAGTSLTLFTEAFVDRQTMFFKEPLPVSFFAAINPIYIIVLTPLFITLLSWLQKKNILLTFVDKFVLGLSFLALSMFVMAEAASFLPEKSQLPMYWLFISYFLATIAELFLSPTALVLASRASLPGRPSLSMSLWFLACAIGNLLGGQLVDLYVQSSQSVFFAELALLALFPAVILWVLRRRFNAWLQMVEK